MHDVTDVHDLGSTRLDPCMHAFAALPNVTPDAPRFVGGHPMAGFERAGHDASDSLLQQLAPWVLYTPHVLDPARLAPLQGGGA